MDDKALMRSIRAANRSWAARVRKETHDLQYDSAADILYVAFGQSGASFSMSIGDVEDNLYLRVEQETFRISGVEILHFRQVFLARHPDAQQAFKPLFDLLGAEDWRVQLKPSAYTSRKAVASRASASHPSLDYLPTFIPRVAPELVSA